MDPRFRGGDGNRVECRRPVLNLRRPCTVAAALLAMLALGACDNLYKQPQDKAFQPSKEAAARGTWPLRPPDGTVARDEAPSSPPRLTAALLARGHERFDIFCAPCHSPVGDGQGIIVHRGFPSPPSFHIDRLRAAPTRHFYDVITNGYGVMYSYRDRVPRSDRWAIAAYIRALQASQHTDVASLPDDAKRKLP
jgi:mono/diheme cytochrome c family protein